MYIYIYMFPVPGSPAPPHGMVPQEPPCQQLPITYVYLLPAIPYYLYTTYYLLLCTTTHPTPQGEGGLDDATITRVP